MFKTLDITGRRKELSNQNLHPLISDAGEISRSNCLQREKFHKSTETLYNNIDAFLPALTTILNGGTVADLIKEESLNNIITQEQELESPTLEEPAKANSSSEEKNNEVSAVLPVTISKKDEIKEEPEEIQETPEERKKRIAKENRIWEAQETAEIQEKKERDAYVRRFRVGLRLLSCFAGWDGQC